MNTITKQRIKEVIHSNGFDENGISNALFELLSEVDKTQDIRFTFLSTKEDIKLVKDDIKLVKDDIKLVIEMFNKRFEDFNKRFEDFNKRFEDMQNSIEKRFDDMNRRITFTQWLMIILFTTYTGIITYITTWVLPHLLK